jgi:hypothetical protein
VHAVGALHLPQGGKVQTGCSKIMLLQTHCLCAVFAEPIQGSGVNGQCLLPRR